MAYKWRWILALLVILLLPVSIMRVHATDHAKPVHQTAGDKGDQKGAEDKDDDADDDDDDADDDDDDDADDEDDGDDDDADEDEDDDDADDGDDDDDDGDDGDVADLPKAIVDAVNAVLPGAIIEEAEKDTDDDAVVFELVVSKDGKSYELRIDDKGTLLSKKEEDADDD